MYFNLLGEVTDKDMGNGIFIITIGNVIFTKDNKIIQKNINIDLPTITKNDNNKSMRNYKKK